MILGVFLQEEREPSRAWSRRDSGFHRRPRTSACAGHWRLALIVAVPAGAAGGRDDRYAVRGRKRLTGWVRRVLADRSIRGLWPLPGARGDWRWILP
jgi:hypothetical protein